MLLAHATGFHGLVWQPLFAHLHGFHGWAPDLRGHGGSTPPSDGDFAWEGFRDDILAIVDEIGAPLVGVGHSKGGAALLMAEQARPGTFDGLYLYEPVVFPGDPTGPDGKPLENPLAKGARRRRSRFRSRDEAYENFVSKRPLSVLDPAALRAYVDHGFVDVVDEAGVPAVELACAPENEARVYEMGLVHRTFDRLGDVACPVVIATGDPDDFGPATFAPPIVDALPDGRQEVFASLGHFGPLEDPAAVAAAIQRAFAATS
jgi:pimeloyl-ACP methyl ester carboxylesterase